MDISSACNYSPDKTLVTEKKMKETTRIKAEEVGFPHAELIRYSSDKTTKK